MLLRGWHDGAVPGNRIGPLCHDLNFDHALLLHLLAYDVLVYGLRVHAPNDCKAALSLPARSPLLSRRCEPLSCHFEPSLSPRNTDIENSRPETGGTNFAN